VTALEVLDWVIRLTYSGMPLPMFRALLIKRREDIAGKGEGDFR